MNRRGTGTVLIAAGALLLAARYITAAIFGSGVSSWSEELFGAMLNYVGSSLLVMAVLLFAAGAAYLIAAEIKKD